MKWFPPIFAIMMSWFITRCFGERYLLAYFSMFVSFTIGFVAGEKHVLRLMKNLPSVEADEP